MLAGVTMAISRERVLEELAQIGVPGGGNLVSNDLVRALQVDPDAIRFVLEAPDAVYARALALSEGRNAPIAGDD